jgi:hypothetical protein
MARGRRNDDNLVQMTMVGCVGCEKYSQSNWILAASFDFGHFEPVQACQSDRRGANRMR